MFRVATLLLSAISLAGCAVSEADFAARRAAMIKDPAAYRKEVQECIDKSPKTASYRAQLATVSGVPQDTVVEVTCERIHKAIASGRLTFAQYDANLKGTMDPDIVRIIQGR